LATVVSVDDVLQAQSAVKEVYLAKSVQHYIIEIVRRTRSHQDFYLGASPRGSLGLYRAAQASAAIRGRNYVIPDDVKALAVPILAHRLILAPGAHLQDLDEKRVLADLLENTVAPGGAFFPD
jgi:MoxR-like ATPase